MNFASSGLKLILGNTLPKAILCGKGALQYGELLDHIERRINEVLAALKFRECDGYSVEDDLVLKIQSAVNAPIGRYPRRQSTAKARRRRYSWRGCAISHFDHRYSWRQTRKRVYLPNCSSNELWQVLDEPGLNRGAKLSLLGF